jgi:flavin reductase (DIM6/NTAB) family NADH-FMN oxidoreductase RutF
MGGGVVSELDGPVAGGVRETGVAVGAFRRAVGRFASGVCVLATSDGRVDHAMTASAFTSVSLEPPLVLVCVETEARLHDALLDNGTWAISVLGAGAKPVADWLATRGRPLHGQLDRVPHRRGPRTGAPLIAAALAWLECRTYAVHAAGDHSVVIGEVVGVELASTQTDTNSDHADRDAALVYYRSEYRRLD